MQAQQTRRNAEVQAVSQTNFLLESLRALQWENLSPQEIYRWAKANVPEHREPVVDDYLKEFCPWWPWGFQEWVDSITSLSEQCLPLKDVREAYAQTPRVEFPAGTWAVGPDDTQGSKLPYRLLCYPIGTSLGSLYWVPGCAVWVYDSWYWYNDVYRDGAYTEVLKPEVLRILRVLDRATHKQLSYDLMHDRDETNKNLGKILWETTSGARP